MACGSAETGFGSLSDQRDIGRGGKSVSCVSDCSDVASAVGIILPVKIAGQPKTFQVGLGMNIVGALFILRVIRVCDGCQHSNNCSHDQQFDNRKSLLACQIGLDHCGLQLIFGITVQLKASKTLCLFDYHLTLVLDLNRLITHITMPNRKV